MALARADLESLLRARQLDRTLTTAIPQADPRDEHALAPSGISALDARLGGGFPRGQLSELVGPRSSGRTSLVLQMIAEATARGELVGMVDALDMLDVESAAAAGVDLQRLLWVRGHVVANPGFWIRDSGFGLEIRCSMASTRMRGWCARARVNTRRRALRSARSRRIVPD